MLLEDSLCVLECLKKGGDWGGRGWLDLAYVVNVCLIMLHYVRLLPRLKVLALCVCGAVKCKARYAKVDLYYGWVCVYCWVMWPPGGIFLAGFIG